MKAFSWNKRKEKALTCCAMTWRLKMYLACLACLACLSGFKSSLQREMLSSCQSESRSPSTWESLIFLLVHELESQECFRWQSLFSSQMHLLILLGFHWKGFPTKVLIQLQLQLFLRKNLKQRRASPASLQLISRAWYRLQILSHNEKRKN